MTDRTAYSCRECGNLVAAGVYVLDLEGVACPACGSRPDGHPGDLWRSEGRLR